MMPSSRLHHPVNAHVENGRLGGSGRQIVNLARKRFSQRSDPSWNLQKNFPATQNCSLERGQYPPIWSRAVILFFINSFFSVIFSRPLRGHVKTKNLLHAFKLVFQDLRIQPGEKSSRTVP